MKIILSILVLGFSLSAFSQEFPKSLTEAQVGAGGIKFVPTKGGSVCNCNTDSSPTPIPENQWNSMLNADATTAPKEDGVSGVDN